MEPDYTDNLGAMSHIKVVPNAYLVPPYSNEKIITQMHMIDPVYAMFGHAANRLYPQTIPPNVESSYAYIGTQINQASWYDIVGRSLDNKTIPSNIGSIQYFSGNHADVGGAGQAHIRYDVYNSINVNSGNMFNYNHNESKKFGK
ncbi:MAG: hypothetical protein NZM04_10375 [Methylacidiphilales bacterium]|nr:hypothetical protein [Candidatus Methylacidiphilales bacterium]